MNATVLKNPKAKDDKQVELGLPHMWPEEILELRRLLSNVAGGYLEFGLGGSTLLALQAGIAPVVAVDSDARWVAAVTSRPDVSEGIADGRTSIIHADIGTVGNFGAPTSTASMQRWPSYIRQPWAEWQRRQAFPQLVLVDGRFRVACCLSVIVARVLMGYTRQTPTVVIHDYQAERPEYEKVLEFFNVLSLTRTLQVMQINENVPPMLAFLRLIELQFEGI